MNPARLKLHLATTIPLIALGLPLLLLTLLRLLHPDIRHEALGFLFYWLPALFTLALAGAFLHHLRSNPPGRKAAGFAAGMMLAIALLFLSRQEFSPQMRVQWDEAELYDTSLAMHFQRTALTPAMAVPGKEPGQVFPIYFRLGRRPPLFPFFTSLTHSFLGANSYNPIRANGFFLVSLFLLTFVVVAARFGITAASAAVLFLASVPLLFWQATSGSMDLAGAFSIALLTATAIAFWRAPSGPALARFVIAGLFASYSRYEVGGLFLLFSIPVLERARRENLFTVASLAMLALVPALMLPILILLFHTAGSFAEAGGGPVFHFSNLAKNLPAFLRAFFWPSIGVYHGPLNLLALLVLLECGRRKILGTAAAFVAGAAMYSLALALSFFDGDPLSFESARLFLFPSLAMALAPLLYLRIFHGRAGTWALLAAAVVFLALSLKANWRSKLLPDSLATLAGEQIKVLAATEPKLQTGKTLVIFDPPEFLLPLGLSAVSSDFFMEHEPELSQLFGEGVIENLLWLRTGTEPPQAVMAGRQIEAAYTISELKRIPLLPLPTILSELRKPEAE